jgi:hypothetical protein
MKWVFVLGVLLVLGLGIVLVPQNRIDREVTGGAAVAPVGTSGTHDNATDAKGGDVITEIETITGANDAMGLVGRRVDLHVDVQDRANDHAFWVGSRDNRLLVVIGRDRRGGSQKQRGEPPNHRIAPVRGGQRAAVSGIIRPAPKAEQRYSWNLTRDDERELADRKIYIDADTVSSEGHGSH